MCPLEHNVVICCLASEKLSFCEWVLKEIEENEDFEFSKMVGTGTQKNVVRGKRNLAMNEKCDIVCSCLL